MDFPTAIDWWYQRVDYERKPPKPGELSLERMRKLLNRLGDPQDKLRIIHIAGSKGKGSTAAMFAAVGQATGLRTGLFTSPHLSDVRERVQIDGNPISQTDLAKLLTEISATEDAADPPTFFEIATAVGFLHFARAKVELAVIEVGLGGRFDSTNVCTPILSVITSISYEHTAILGDTLAKIAFEKCGIIKPAAPVISGVTAPEAAAVVRQTAHERGCTLRELGTDFHVTYTPGQVAAKGSMNLAQVTYFQDSKKDSYELGLLGAHQAANASLVLASNLLPFAASHEGLAKVKWPARMEIFPGHPLIVLDCAHNGASAQTVVDTLAESFPPGQRTLLFASANDKDVDTILQTLLPTFSAAIFTRFRTNPRAVPPERLREVAAGIRSDIAYQMIDDPAAALAAARASATDQIVICGSVYLAGELRHLLTGS